MDVSGKRITVMGLGRFGGGVGVARWLAAQGAQVLVTDTAPEADLADSLAQIEDLVAAGRIKLRLGEHDLSDFRTCQMVVANPAVPRPWENRYLRAAGYACIPITTEMGLTLRRVDETIGRERTIGITGSVGKSTTTAMIAHALGAVGEAVLMGGNIGGSLLGELDGLAPGAKPWVVLEISSAMLHWVKEERMRWSPRVGVMTNIAENHTDWHGNMDHYVASKRNLLRHQVEGDGAVIGASAAEKPALGKGARLIVTSDEALAGRTLRVPGAHNRLNAAMALEACVMAVGEGQRPALVDALCTFGGLPHRLEMVGERRGIVYYNDSKCTTPEAMLKALDALESAGIARANIHLLAGGYDKKIDLGPVADAARQLGGLHCLGATGPAIFALAKARGVRVLTLSSTLSEAVAAAQKHLKRGDALLLSPASASWDQYPNYEHRGNEFKRLVAS
ncbi:MAG: UDP-N-acetylmuramoyl-L-alanine--D-glutamate ligase [Phycisphaerales bacterium]